MQRERRAKRANGSLLLALGVVVAISCGSETRSPSEGTGGSATGGVSASGGDDNRGGGDSGGAEGGSIGGGASGADGGMGASGGLAGGGAAGVNGEGGAARQNAGVVQKGPFILGTTITLQELDSNLNPTGRSFAFQTDDDLGHFDIPTNVTSRFVEIISQGYYFDELSNQLSNSPLTLRTLSDLNSSNSININLLTTLAASRERALLATGQSYASARTQAELEVLSALSFAGGASGAFDQMDISRSGSDNALLLAASVMLERLAYEHGASSPVAQLLQIISAVSADIARDGSYDDALTASELRCVIPTRIDKAAVRANLEERYGSLGASAVVPDFEPFIAVPASCCVTDNKRCSGALVQSCDDVGRWLDVSNCSGATPACKNGRCEALCSAGDKRCSGAIAQLCDSAGLWQDNGNCRWSVPAVLQSDHPLTVQSLLGGETNRLGLVVDSAGIVTAIWQQRAPSSPDAEPITIASARYVPGAGWSQPQLVNDANVTTAGQPSLAVTPSGEVTAGWVQMQPNDPNPSRVDNCVRSYLPGSGWEAAAHVLATTEDNFAMAVGYSASTPVAVWTSGFQVQTSQRTGSASWSAPATIPIGSEGLLRTSIRLVGNGSGMLAAGWLQLDGTRSYTDVRLYEPATGWSMPHLLGSGTSGNVAALSVSASNEVLVVGESWWTRYTEASGWHLEKVDNQWYTTLGLASDVDGSAIELRYGCEGSCTEETLQARRYDATYGWRKPVLLDDTTWAFGNSAQIAMDPAGNGTAVWERFSNTTSAIWVRRYRYDSGWEAGERIQTIPVGDGDAIPAIVVDKKGRVTALWSEAGSAEAPSGRRLVWARFEYPD